MLSHSYNKKFTSKGISLSSKILFIMIINLGITICMQDLFFDSDNHIEKKEIASVTPLAKQAILHPVYKANVLSSEDLDILKHIKGSKGTLLEYFIYLKGKESLTSEEQFAKDQLKSFSAEELKSYRLTDECNENCIGLLSDFSSCIKSKTVDGKALKSFSELNFINENIWDKLETETLQYIDPSIVHEEILSYEDYIRQCVSSSDWDYLYSTYLGGKTHQNIEFITQLVMAIMQVESGRDAEHTLPSKEQTGAAWGICQIEDTSYGSDTYRSSGIDQKNEHEIIKTIKLKDRLDAKKSIEWFTSHFHNILLKTEGDFAKAIQGYNFGIFGLQWLCDDYGSDWFNHLDDIESSIAKRTGTLKRNHGDDKYLFKVLAYLK